MKRYKVVGSSPIDHGGKSHVPGDEFSAALDDGHETFLVEIGALEVVNETGKVDDKEKD